MLPWALLGSCLALARPARAWPLPEALSEQGPWRSVGNHRFELRVPASAEPKSAFLATVRWRRHDPEPEAKGTVLLDALSQLPVDRCRRLNVSQEEGSFAFSGVPGGVYHLYYMPFETCEFAGGTCPFGQRDDVEGMVQYRAFTGACQDETWWSPGDVGEALVASGAPEGRTLFDALGPMELAATDAERAALLQQAGGLLVVAEDRSSPIRMRDQLPLPWTTRPFADLARLSGAAQPGEAFTWQVGVTANVSLTILRAALSTPLAGPAGASIPTSALRCLNLGGVDFWGRSFNATPAADPMQVIALWFVLHVPEDAPLGDYRGSLAIQTSAGQRVLNLDIAVRGPVLHDRGYGDLWRGARVDWLDSTLGNQGDVPPPFVPLAPAGQTVTMLDKVMIISEEGLLASVKVSGMEALDSPMRLEVVVAGAVLDVPMTVTLRQVSNMSVSWAAGGAVAGASVNVAGTLDATGYADFVADVDCDAAHEVRLVLPNRAVNAVYAAGLGKPGGYLRRWFPTPSPVIWKWDGLNGNNAVWVGSTKSGLRLSPKGDDPLWQAGVPFDSSAAPPAPAAWSNGGSGGIAVYPNGTAAVFTGGGLVGRHTFRFSVMATPVRPLDLPKHVSERYAQVSGPLNLTLLKQGGATVVNVHQGNILNPWINYPYLTNTLLKEATDAAHRMGIKLKVYNTMRELSNRALELWALRALNETFVWRDGEGGGGDWLREHLGGGYSVAWSTPMDGSGFWNQQIDMAIRVKALSRWNNYYVEGLRQIVADYGCDGIYLDEIAYDRVTLLRAKAVLGADRLIDHHSDRGGFTASPATNYMELFPFIDSLWYGEGFDYDNAAADYWLVEISGIPFGLNSDLLRYTGMTPFHFRGMLFASANRWQDNLGMRTGSTDAFDPRAVWRLWDSFGIASSQMYGWWLVDEGVHVPVTTNSSDVKCTVYVKDGSSLLALANFGVAQSVTLGYDWAALGLDSRSSRLRAPVLPPMQPEERTWRVDDPILVPASEAGSPSSREGWLLLLEPASVIAHI